MAKIDAYYNEDRWIAECPKCHWAIQIAPGFRQFVCGQLPSGVMLPGGCGYKAEVEWPSNYGQIVIELKKRPRKENRNWYPGESIADLRRQLKKNA